MIIINRFIKILNKSKFKAFRVTLSIKAFKL